MKFISFLYSTSIKTFPKRGILLEDNIIAVIDQEVDEDETAASEKAKHVIQDATLETATWWWPSARAFREIHGISEFAILNMLKEYGFTLSGASRLEHKQVEKDEPLLRNYIEVKMAVPDEKYATLCKEFGNIKT